MTNSIEKQKSKKLKLIYTRGLPASGKSTWARKMQSENPGKYKLVSLDDIRETLDQSVFNKDNEKFAKKIQELIITNALSSDYSVIVHNTHLHEKYNTYYDDLVKMFPGWYATVECKDFTHVPLEECIKNDANRVKSVGKKVIVDMYNKFIAKKEKEITQYRDQNPNKTPCVLVDVDGTLAQMAGRSPYDWARVGEDKVNEPVADLVRQLHVHDDTKIIIMSGRDGSCKEETVKWLNDNDIPFDDIFMRTAGDQRKDSVVKEELFYNHIEPNYRVRFVLDDRDVCIKLWREVLNLPCFQVNYGDF